MGAIAGESRCPVIASRVSGVAIAGADTALLDCRVVAALRWRPRASVVNSRSRLVPMDSMVQVKGFVRRAGSNSVL